MEDMKENLNPKSNNDEDFFEFFVRVFVSVVTTILVYFGLTKLLG